MKVLFVFLCLVACSKKEELMVSDDYVLVEFASKLEEDYQRLSGEESLPSNGDGKPKK